MNSTIKRDIIEQYLNTLLRPELFDDYGPNGLQIEGCESIKKIAFAVSVSQKSIQQAQEAHAQALIVHHGLFWKFQGPKTITGDFAKRIRPLIKNDINLFAYHLPLDAHLEIGNAATLAKLLGGQNFCPFGMYKNSYIGIKAEFVHPCSTSEIQEKLKNILKHPIIVSSTDSKAPIKTFAIITGGASSEWREAKSCGIDAYITGEMKEHDWHEAQEAGIHMFAGGHHATERLGIISLMDNIKLQFPDLECVFLDSENPV